VDTVSERGLLGIDILNSTKTGTAAESKGGDLRNRVYRYEWNGQNQNLVHPTLILDLPALPGPNHNGGKLVIGPDHYYGGDGSVIKNNIIRELYFGLYTFGVGHMIVENNVIRNSGHYGLDLHTGTHDMIIRNNTVYNNNGSGIICSLNCYNIMIENNKVHDNAGDAIDFSRNMYNSIARNNIVYNEPSGVFVSQSHNNQVYNNTISKSRTGLNVNSGSYNNKIFGNTITNSMSNAILLASGASGNTFSSNKIISVTPNELEIQQDPTTKNNIFSNNPIIHSSTSTTTNLEPSETPNARQEHADTS
jgi:parallel beta-helix repeat protein